MAKELAARQKQLLALFKRAIETERKAQEMYADMLATCDDAALRQVLNVFRKAEARHEEVLIQKYAELRELRAFKE